MRRWLPALALAVVATALLTACNDAPLSWDTLLTRRINETYPAYLVDQPATGRLAVQRPGQRVVEVDSAGIALRCQRGLRDCNDATEQMLLDLR